MPKTKDDTTKNGEVDRNNCFHNGYYFRQRHATSRSQQKPKNSSTPCTKTDPHLAAVKAFPNHSNQNACSANTRPHLFAGANSFCEPNKCNLCANTGYAKHTANPPLTRNAIRDEDNYYYFYRQPERPTNLDNSYSNACPGNCPANQGCNQNGDQYRSNYPNHTANPPLTRNAVRDEDNYYYFYRQPEQPPT